MATYANGLIEWGGGAGQPVYVRQPDGSMKNVGAPEHGESASYVSRAVSDPQVEKVIALYNAAPEMLNNEQKAFIASGMVGMDSFGQGYRWGPQNLFDNVFDPQQAGTLLQTGFARYLSPQDISAGQQFNYNESPAQQSARDDDGGMFGMGGLGELALLAAAIYSGGAALGAWGGAGGAAGATTASGMLASESAALLAEGFSAAEVASSLAGLGNAAEIGSILTAAGVPAATASTLASQAATGSLGAAGTGAATQSGGMLSGAPLGSLGSGVTGVDIAGAGLYGQTPVTMGTLGSGLSGTSAASLGLDAGMLSGAGAAASYEAGAVLDAATAAAAAGNGAGASLIPGLTNAQLVSGGLSLVGGLLSGNAAQGAARTSADAQLEAARIAADAAKFRPVGVTTRFGQSNFTKDAQGNVTGAGYTLSPELKAMQDSLLGAAPGMLSQFTGSQSTTAPMGTAAQRAMSLGNQYLATDPLAQAQKYYNDQQAVMATQRARDEAGMLTGEFNRGTYGLATGATGQMGAANPRLEALYNAQRQQDIQLAANATQGGMDYAKFGAGMVGTGGDLLKGMYGTQTASYAPFQTALGGAQTIEGLGQNALDLSINMGKVASPAQSGQLLAQGMLGAAQTMQPANSYSPWGALLSGAGNAVQNMAQPQQGTSWYDPSKYRLTPI